MIVALLFIGFLILPLAVAEAVLPPDFIYGVGSQLMQVFSLSLIFLAAVAGTIVQYLRLSVQSFRLNRWHRIGIIALVVALTIIMTSAIQFWLGAW